MARSDGYFRPGQSGNPRGRPPGRASLRELVRRELMKPMARAKDGRTMAEVWASRLVAGAVTTDDMLAVLRWLEGSAPSADNLAVERTAEMLDELESGEGEAA